MAKDLPEKLQDWRHIVSLKGVLRFAYAMSETDKAHEIGVAESKYYEKYSEYFDPETEPVS